MRILISGGSGLIGKAITPLLQKNGHEVAWLSRQDNQKNIADKVFKWNPKLGEIDDHAIEWAEAIINLAGANIAEKPWSDARKQELLLSRTQPLETILNALNRKNKKLSVFIAASATGFYGAGTDPDVKTELSPKGNDYLAQLTEQWEAASDKLAILTNRYVKLRIGVVLSANGGAFPKLTQTLKYGFVTPIGNGKQPIPWIDIDDLASLYLYITQSSISGTINAVAPNHITMYRLVETVKSVQQKSIVLPGPPAWLLKIFLGEMAIIVTKGNKVISETLNKTSFVFNYSDIETSVRKNLIKI